MHEEFKGILLIIKLYIFPLSGRVLGIGLENHLALDCDVHWRSSAKTTAHAKHRPGHRSHLADVGSMRHCRAQRADALTADRGSSKAERLRAGPDHILSFLDRSHGGVE